MSEAIKRIANSNSYRIYQLTCFGVNLGLYTLQLNYDNLKAIKRESTSSGSNNKLRAEGLIPAILYGGKDANQNISIKMKEIKALVNSDTFLSKVLELEIDGKREKVIPREVAFNVVSEEPIHIDFMRIVSGKKIVLEIPVKFINHPDLTRIKKRWSFKHRAKKN